METSENNIRFSVIMCALNLEKIINTAIDSVLEQNFKNFELILVNDGSTDHTSKIINDYAKKDSRIKVFHKKMKE